MTHRPYTPSGRPQPGEYAAFAESHMQLVVGDDAVSVLASLAHETLGLLAPLTDDAVAGIRYAPGKWNVKEVLGHINDTERIMCNRALRLSRNDKTPIEGYEQDDYVRFGPHAHVKLVDLVEEFTHIRRATISFVRQLDAEAWARRGVTNKYEISVRALAYVIAGHELHHRNILVERYFSVAA